MGFLVTLAASLATAAVVGVSEPSAAEVQLIAGWVQEQVPVPERSSSTYSRSAWPHWLDSDGDCQDTRQEVLLRADANPQQLILRVGDCAVLLGHWFDPYTGAWFTDPLKVDVDHVVPLKEAHESGGAGWSRERRAAFANDLSVDVPQLKAVSASANRAKGAKDPAEWLPAVGRCRYLVDWAAVKRKWGLRMDAAERNVLLTGFAGCN